MCLNLNLFIMCNIEYQSWSHYFKRYIGTTTLCTIAGPSGKLRNLSAVQGVFPKQAISATDSKNAAYVWQELAGCCLNSLRKSF